MIKLSLLICTLDERKFFFERLKTQLVKQKTDEVEFLSACDNRENTIGFKRNLLLQSATGEYVAFIDDDDRISENYVKLLMEGIDKGVDCCSLVGQITFNGRRPQKFVHSLDFKEYKEVNKVYQRPPNHLNCIKRSIAKEFVFPEINMYEDTNWAMQICNAGVLQTEHRITETIYYYDYIHRKK